MEKNSRISKNINKEELLEISEGYQKISPNDPNYFYIPIIVSGDIHGFFYEKQYKINNITVKYGGLEYLGKYISIIRNEFPGRTLYLDGGDTFQGGIESELTDRKLISEFLNIMEVNASTFGNHEFDFKKEDLLRIINRTNFPFLLSNVYSKEKKSNILIQNKIFSSKIFTIEVPENRSIKIGVIGLTMYNKGGYLIRKGYNISFLNYKEELTKEVKGLKSKTDAIILLAHIGLDLISNDNPYEFKLRSDNITMKEYKEVNQLNNFYDIINKDLVDIIISSHVHENFHGWIKGVPFTQGNKGRVIYLPFKKNSMKNKYELIHKEIKIEGPFIQCEKIFEGTKNCIRPSENMLNKLGKLVHFQFHGIKIEKEPKLKELSEKYFSLYKPYLNPLFKLKCPYSGLILDGTGNSLLGSMFVDILREITGTDLSVLGHSYLRNSWYPGIITEEDFINMVPYPNRICTFKMNGKEVYKMLNILQQGTKKVYITSGLNHTMIQYKNGTQILGEVKVFDGKKWNDLEMEKYYSLSSVDFFIKDGGEDFRDITEWYPNSKLDCNHEIFSHKLKQYFVEKKIYDANIHKSERFRIMKKDY